MNLLAASAVISTKAAAPSLILLALAAVTVPGKVGKYRKVGWRRSLKLCMVILQSMKRICMERSLDYSFKNLKILCYSVKF